MCASLFFIIIIYIIFDEKKIKRVGSKLLCERSAIKQKMVGNGREIVVN
jgi:hypothetical protein